MKQTSTNQTRKRSRWLRLSLPLFLFLLGLLMPNQQARAADPTGTYFNRTYMIEKVNYSPDYGYVHYNFAIVDNYGTGRDEYLGKVWVYFDGKNIFDGYTKVGDGSGNRTANPFYISYRGNVDQGDLYAYSGGPWSSFGYVPGNAYVTESYKLISSSGYWYPMNQTNGRDTYAKLYYYPHLVFSKNEVSKSFSVALRNIEVKLEDYPSKIKALSDQSKTLTLDRPYTLTTSSNLGKIKADGYLDITASTSLYSTMYVYKNSSLEKTQLASGETTYNFASSKPDRTLYLNGATYQIKTKANRYDSRSNVWVNDESFTTEKIAMFNWLTASNQTDGTIDLKWNITNPSSGGRINTSSFVVEVSTNNLTWTTLSGVPAYSTSKTNYEMTYTIPEANREKGEVTYYFRVNRAGFNKGAFQASRSVKINTNYKRIGIGEQKDAIQHIAGTNTARITWALDNGLWVNDRMNYQLWENGLLKTDIAPMNSDTIVTSYLLENLESCKNYKYELRLYVEGKASPVSTQVIAESFLIDNTAAEISSFDASKGYYSGRVILNWVVEKTKSDFTKFEVYRKDLSASSAQEILLQEISHDRTRVNYNIEDNTAEPGVYYSYSLKGIVQCEGETGVKSAKTSVGFSQPYGTVSGRITYTGSQAVEGVQVVFEGKDQFMNRSLYFKNDNDNYLDIPTGLFNDKQMTFQSWIRIENQSDYRQILRIVGSSRTLQLRVNGSILYLTLGSTNLAQYQLSNPNEYFHLSFTYNRINSSQVAVGIYINGDQVMNSTLAIASLGTKINKLYIGAPDKGNFVGYIDEIRFWNRVLSTSEIENNYDRYINGKETGLKAYYRLDEPTYVSGAAYDCSAEGSNYNKNHAIIGSKVHRSDTNVVPTASQLALKAVTDKDGNYLMNSLPYISDGTTYIVTPMFGIHQFNPNSKPLYVSANANTFNNFDFEDVSAFEVTGWVYYKNSNYPVDSAHVSIDGTTASKDGKLVMTDSDGKFTVEVPIGSHFITVSKTGHKFVKEGRFPSNKLEKYNFQESISDLIFYDETTVRLVGRVAGGQPETDKPLGFGLSKANIGKATIVLKPVNDIYSLNKSGNDSIVDNNVIGGKMSKTTFKASDVESKITIETNPETGEFLAVLPPVPYKIDYIGVKGIEDTFKDGDEADFTLSKQIFDMNPMMEQTLKYTDPKTNQELNYAYHDTVKITLYNEPVIIVEDKGAVAGAYGDSIYIHTDYLTGKKDSIPLYSVNNGVVNYALGVPVLTQKQLVYNWKIEAYEEYLNKDIEGKEVLDKVPLAGKQVNISNALAAERLELDQDTYEETSREESNTTLVLDSLGTRNYKFKVSFPNMAGNHQLGAKLSLELNGKTFSWEKNAILLGQMPSDGNNFVTNGPDYVDIILRDPPGSNSRAYIEKGSSFTHSVEHTDVKTVTESVESTIHAGFEEEVGKGIGLILITDIKNQADILLGTEIEEEFTDNNSRQTTISFNQEISTSSDPNYVGSMADVYIGRSTNLVYGLVNQLALYPTNDKPGDVTASGVIGDYSLFNKSVNTVGVEFGTMFTYTQTHLIDHQIPQWKKLRDQLIIPVTEYPKESSIVWGSDKVKYVSRLSKDDPNFGQPTTYKIYYAPNATSKEKAEDKVWEYNTNILNWEARIRDNERMKVNMFNARAEYEENAASTAKDTWNDKRFFENVSYDAGVGIEKSIEVKYEAAEINQTLITAGGYAGFHSGFAIAGIGVEAEAKVNAKRQQGDQITETEESTMKFGYSLSEDESVLFAGKDALSVDVYAPSVKDIRAILGEGETINNLVGYTFRTRAGQTSCPYEAADSTLYYLNEQEKPYLLNYGTFQIEKPDLMINNQRDTASMENIPSGREATFTLQMSNLSEAGMDVTYQIYPNNATNPDGLILSIDGEALTQARQIRIPYGQTLTKTLKVRQSTTDVLEYEGVGIRLGSVCDIDTYSETFINVSFTPSSSPVTLRSDSKLANIEGLESGANIRFTISDYDRTYKNFSCIRFQYRRSTDESWTTLKEYANDENLPYKLSYDYTYTEKIPNDGEYIFRALTVSLDGYKEVTSSSEEITIVKDTKIPEIMGNPLPSNGILRAGDEISIVFNEDIQSGKLTPDRFTITGIPNASIRKEPTVGLSFTGVECAYTEQPIYTNGSFSIEAWVQWPEAKAGTIFAYGSGNDFISLGFDAQGHAVVRIGEQTKTSSLKVNPSEVWKYIGISYSRDRNTVSVYVFEESKNINLFLEEPFESIPAIQGKLYVGNTSTKSNGFRGAVSFLHFYNTTRSGADTSSKYETKSGTEPNLIGFWEIEEGEGTIAKDKARSRHLSLGNASWYIYPAGKTLAFNGSNQYATIESALFPFLPYNDFTWEFWFKGNNQGAATLFSCGLDAYIGLDADHRLILTMEDQTQILSSANLLDDQWHHVALSVKRTGMSNALVDGVVTASFNSSIFANSIGGGKYYLGVKYYRNSSNVLTTTEYFKGNMDELRVWGSALSTDVINLNRNSKLRGDEAGLKAYYPFEQYEHVNGSVYAVNASLKDMVKGSSNVATSSGSISDISTPMKDCRPVKNIPFTFTASNNKIVLNLTEEAHKIEGVTLYVTAKNILDMHNNVSNVISWIAYVDQHSLKWDDDEVNLVIEEGTTESFKTTIVNNSGESVDYMIENVPEWLVLDQLQGTLKPTTSKNITFSVAPGVNIGSYEASIALTDVTGIREILPVTLRVTGPQPDWSVNPHDFTMSMSVVGSIRIDGAPQEDSDDILAAFIDGQCVGVAQPGYYKSNNAYFVFMNINGNAVHEDKAVSFKLWDAGTGRIYPSVVTSQGGTTNNIKFLPGETRYANVSSPVVFNALNVIEQQIAANPGWNWVSVNVESNAPSLLSQMKDQLGSNGIQIKGQNAYLDANPWAGDLTSISTKNSYLVGVTNGQVINMQGTPTNVSQTAITIANKWNWIGYTPQLTTSVKNALAGINAKDGDQIKSQNEFSVYDANNGWIGTLNYMRPGKGYMYYSTNASSFNFTYPNVISVLRSEQMEEELEETYWYTDYRRFANNMTITSVVRINGQEIKSEQIEVAAFVNGECRGNARLVYQDGLYHDHLGFLMVYGESGDEVSFKIYDHQTGTQYLATNDKVSFKANNRYGTAGNPYVIYLDPTSLEEVSIEDIAIYPNPVETILNLHHSFESLDRVEVVDVSGRTLQIKENLEEKTMEVGDLTPGMYMLRITNNNESVVLKFNKK
ncbi:T9SS type A sorting domain-containing protein [Bacteroidales bacterium OttesenSCG-928-J19]|nr:T9SS type A sorting domain-containing protein [Bacteroidales bacterium OttesenSCG-928-J19]